MRRCDKLNPHRKGRAGAEHSIPLRTMADHIDLTKDSDDEGQNTFESDAALARRLSAELNGEAPKNNKRTIDLTADSQEEPAPRPAQRARTSRIHQGDERDDQAAAGLPTKDLIDKPGTETRYEQALDRLAERARARARPRARARARDARARAGRRAARACSPSSSRTPAAG